MPKIRQTGHLPNGSVRTRRPYSPPRVEQIEIVPDESMLGMCKAVAGADGAAPTCGYGCLYLGS